FKPAIISASSVPPNEGADGKIFSCRTSDPETCVLHLHSVTSPHNFGRIFSSPTPGFVIGSTIDDCILGDGLLVPILDESGVNLESGLSLSLISTFLSALASFAIIFAGLMPPTDALTPTALTLALDARAPTPVQYLAYEKEPWMEGSDPPSLRSNFSSTRARAAASAKFASLLKSDESPTTPSMTTTSTCEHPGSLWLVVQHLGFDVTNRRLRVYQLVRLGTSSCQPFATLQNVLNDDLIRITAVAWVTITKPTRASSWQR
ncbi:hypothetical protein B0H34DRAFT_428090, partial [Crassisporium funariophilum]